MKSLALFQVANARPPLLIIQSSPQAAQLFQRAELLPTQRTQDLTIRENRLYVMS